MTPDLESRARLTPIRAILTHAARRGWCDVPNFEAPGASPPRTEWLTPAEADRLVAAATAHLRPLITFLLATGARLGEALALEWPVEHAERIAMAILRAAKEAWAQRVLPLVFPIGLPVPGPGGRDAR